MKQYAESKHTPYKIYQEKISGKNMERPKLAEMLREVHDGDVVIVTKLDRLARSLKDLLDILTYLGSQNCGFVSLGDPALDTTTPNGKLLLQIMGAFAEWERSIIRERTESGRRRAKAQGIKFGRPKLKTSKKNGGKFIDPLQVIDLKHKGLSARAIAKVMGCSITPVLKIIKEN